MSNHDANTAAFIAQIEKLDVSLTVGPDGVFTACSSVSEPLFCFDGFSQQEVADRVKEAIVSYGRLYHGIEDLRLQSSREDVAPPSVRVETHKQIAKIGLALQDEAA